MNRRDLLKAASAVPVCIAMGTAGGAAPHRARAASGKESVDIDVLVVGGGTAGIIAAIQAARAGARTLVVEMAGQLGGTTTIGGVTAPGLFHAWGRQVIAGIGWELVMKAVELDGGTLPDFSKPAPSHAHHQVRINGPLYAALAEEAVLEAGAAVAYYESPLSVRETDGGWLVETAGKGLRRTITCRQLIDCTGGADVVGMIGLARLREAESQPGTLIFRLGNYDAASLDAERIQARYREALATGELRDGDYLHKGGRFVDFLRSGGYNAQHVFGADSSTSASQTSANIAGRASVLRLLRFTRTLPGCKHARLVSMQQATAVRETYRIVGEVQITVDDYTCGRVFEDAIGYTFYPIDLHGAEGVRPKPLAPGTVPTIPLRALVPQGSRNLLVAGRSISSDRLANSALRVQASCMAMGQAAGAAAALAARQKTTLLAVPLEELRELLRKHRAILPA
ncbi:MAG: FAD-dependent oxidoreductase [Phycisphaerae bacterium]|nr:FAD-dependent oxidoreductase [Phycisphaerae bacterium]